MSKFNNEFNSNIKAKDKEIESLKSQIDIKSDEINKLMHSQTLALIELQNKNTKTVYTDEFIAEIRSRLEKYLAN